MTEAAAKVMTSGQALSEVLRLREEGLKTEEIAKRLVSAGYRTAKGKVPTVWTVYRMFSRAGQGGGQRREAKKRAPKKAAPPAPKKAAPPAPKKAAPPSRGRSDRERLKAVRALLEVSSIEPADRITLALLALEGEG